MQGKGCINKRCLQSTRTGEGPTRALDGHLCVVFKHQVLDQLICLGRKKEIKLCLQETWLTTREGQEKISEEIQRLLFPEEGPHLGAGEHPGSVRHGRLGWISD